jgi:hypothetical protein
LHFVVSLNTVFLMPRNSQFSETSLLADAASTLQDRLPKSWHVDVVTAAKERRQYDARLTLTSADGAEATFIVEVKIAARASAKDLVNQLRAMAPAGSTQHLLLVTEYANPPLRRELEEAAISYLDTTGWAYLASNDPAVLIRLEGANKPPRPRESAATARLNGPAAARAIRHLLEAQPPLGIRELATQSSSSPAAVSKLMPTLADAGAVERSEDGTISRIRRRTLLDRWTADYSFVNSNGVVLDYIAPRGIARTLQRISDRHDIIVSGSAAAREYLPVETTSVVPLGLLTLYGDDITGIARTLELVRADRTTSNVMMTTPRDRKLLDEGQLSPSGFLTAPIGQVLADLLTLPRGRLAQEAEQLIDVLAMKDASWRE